MAYDPVELYIALIRDEDTAWFVVGDNGKGMTADTLAETVFRVSDTSASTGVLNNVGWGKKQALAWFEAQVEESGLTDEDGDRPAFRIVTSPRDDDEMYKVEGPLSDGSGMLVERATEEEWAWGIKGEITDLNAANQGTRVHIPCSWEQVTNDLWGGEETTLTTRVQELRTQFGIMFRRLLNAREENRITLTVVDRDDPDMASIEVHPIDLQFETYVGKERPVTFDITTDEETYNVEYERGKLDFDAMAEAAQEHDERLLTSGDMFRTGYKPSKKYQGVDIYANGRVMMQNVPEDLYRQQDDPDEYLSRDDVYNHFGGEVRIIPKTTGDEVPTDNKKTAVDTSSEFWAQLEAELRKRGGPVNTYKMDSSETDTDDDGPDEDNEPDGEGGDSSDDPPGDGANKTGETGGTGPAESGGDGTGASDGDHRDGGDGPSDSDPDGGDDGSPGTAGDESGGPDADDVDAAEIDNSEFRQRWQNNEFDHDDLVDRLSAKLEAEEMTQRVHEEKHYKGTRVDIVQVLESGEHILWEVRTSQQNWRGIYDISMYQDVFKETVSSDAFRRSVLLSDGLSSDAEDALHSGDGRRDVCGELYELDQQDIAEKLG
jgi:hypothetical protein